MWLADRSCDKQERSVFDSLERRVFEISSVGDRVANVESDSSANSGGEKVIFSEIECESYSSIQNLKTIGSD